MIDDEVFRLAQKVIAELKAKNHKMVTVESCTGGLIAAALTEVSGSSAVVEGGLVTYSNALKKQLANVQQATLERYGAVSEETAREMATGALERLPTANIAVAVTGVAGPDGGSVQKPVGTVCFALALRGHAAQSQRLIFSGDRHAVRRATVLHALEMAGSL